MNKKIAIGIAVVILLAGGAYYFQSQNKTKVSDDGQMSSEKNGAGNSIAESIRDMMNRGAVLECTYEANGEKTTAYIKGKSVRSTSAIGNDPKAPNNFLYVDSKIYFWNDTTKEGMFMTAPEQKADSQPKTNETQFDKDINTDIVGQLEQYKNSCKPSSVSDSLFTVPSNVKFQDFSELMKQIPQVPSIPTN